ncbi:MAG: hypothetical protein JWP08_4034 [Bryobacterales bacterium]|nr:hypothetical protein [Bryobacterales bacterium]
MPNNEEHPAANEHAKVVIKVDGVDKEIRPGSYTLSDFKTAVEIDQSKVIEQLIDGQFVDLADDGRVTVKKGEVFASHVRRGGSSWA